MSCVKISLYLLPRPQKQTTFIDPDFLSTRRNSTSYPSNAWLAHKSSSSLLPKQQNPLPNPAAARISDTYEVICLSFHGDGREGGRRREEVANGNRSGDFISEIDMRRRHGLAVDFLFCRRHAGGALMQIRAFPRRRGNIIKMSNQQRDMSYEVFFN
ncbi:hypothetical protein WMY93_020234 [Mugilogobius chulae]|uniref:Uncharacterized protein n=1 Tax=Mugilogobius chulae TaxID=88201 RepID=A0AAW0NTA3_9GOBI